MRVIQFTMERDMLNIGDKVQVTEGKLPRAYYYMAEPAAAMSVNIPFPKRLSAREGVVVTKERIGASFDVGIQFDE